MRHLFAGFVFSVMLTGVAAAGPLEEGVTAWKQRDYAAAEQLLRPLAERGVPRAQYLIGLIHDISQGRPKDYSEALKWYRLAAEQGFSGGQYGLALLYLNGEGVPQDHAEAVKWFRLAAKSGFAPAQHNLGVCYKYGKGVPQDYVLAHMWFNLAAARGGDEPETLRYAITSKWPKGADAGQSKTSKADTQHSCPH